MPSRNVIKNNLNIYLKGFIDNKRSMLEPSVSPNKDYKNILMLSYYRNTLVHHFLLDSYVVISLLSKFNQTPQTKDAIWKDVAFLAETFQYEFIKRNVLPSKEEFENVLRSIEAEYDVISFSQG